jgi:hypothetical protein
MDASQVSRYRSWAVISFGPPWILEKRVIPYFLPVFVKAVGLFTWAEILLVFFLEKNTIKWLADLADNLK